MPLRIVELLAYGAYALRSRYGEEVAIAARGAGNILGLGRGSGNSIDTPIVNLLQNTNLNGNYFIISTLPSTEACKGMAKIKRAAHIYEFQGAALQRFDLAGNAPWAVQNPPGNLPVVQNLDPIAGFGALNSVRKNMSAFFFLQNIAPAQLPPFLNGFLQLAPAGQLPAPVGIAMPAAVGQTAGPFTTRRRKIYMLLAHSIVAARALRNPGGGHSIGCVLVDNTGAILDVALNEVNLNPTFHAETVAIMKHPNIPAQSYLFTTLESCYMCAGMFVTAFANSTVIYAQTDPIMPQNALARGVNGCAQRLDDIANFGHQLRAAHQNNIPRTTDALNSVAGTALAMDAVHAFKRMQHYDLQGAPAADVALWNHGKAIINTVRPNLIP